MSEKNPIQVSDRIFRTIELLARSGPSGLLDISNELELNKSTVHRILNSLICMDYVKQDPDTSKYSLTFKICSLSNQVLSHNSLIDIADMDDDQIRQIWEQSELHTYTANTFTDYNTFLEVIGAIRNNGYSMDNEEMEIGVRCIAVSLGCVHHKLPYAISISAPKDRMKDKQITQYKKLLLNTKKQLLAELGQ